MTRDPIFLYPVGTRVRDGNGLTGRVKAIERQSNGEPSEIPYNIEWDDNSQAHRTRGWLFIYAMHEELTKL